MSNSSAKPCPKTSKTARKALSKASSGTHVASFFAIFGGLFASPKLIKKRHTLKASQNLKNLAQGAIFILTSTQENLMIPNGGFLRIALSAHGQRTPLTGVIKLFNNPLHNFFCQKIQKFFSKFRPTTTLCPDYFEQQ